jgi:hypothetical protein
LITPVRMMMIGVMGVMMIVVGVSDNVMVIGPFQH